MLSPQICIQERSQNLCHFYVGKGLKLGVFRFFPVTKTLWFVRCICHLHVVWSEHEDITCYKMPHGAGRSWMHLLLHVWLAKTPNLSPMADHAITRGDIQGLGSSLYIRVRRRQSVSKSGADPGMDPLF